MTSEPDIAECILVKEFAYEGTGKDDQYLIELYKTKDGKHFVYIASSGYNSIFSAALGFDTWIAAEKVDDWVTFTQNL